MLRQTCNYYQYHGILFLVCYGSIYEYTNCISADKAPPSNDFAQLADCRIHQLHLCRGVRPPTSNKCPAYDTKQSNDEVSVMVELLGMWSTPSLPMLPGPLWPGVVAPDRVLSIGQIELNCVHMLNWITSNRTVLIFKLRTYAKLNSFK